MLKPLKASEGIQAIEEFFKVLTRRGKPRRGKPRPRLHYSRRLNPALTGSKVSSQRGKPKKKIKDEEVIADALEAIQEVRRLRHV